MNNVSVQHILDDCRNDLIKINHLIVGMGVMADPVPFLTSYALIKTCGTIEFCFKTIIADIHVGASRQVQNYINRKIRESSMNPTESNICNILKSFDENWNKDFKAKLNSHADCEKIKSSLTSLNEARNIFAHGRPSTISFNDVQEYFEQTRKLIEILDDVVHL